MSSLNGQITKGLNLKTPSGETWLVDVTKNADELLFKSGWDDFVRAHDLQENDLLIFKCSGNCSFDVLILDSSGCEKVSCLFTTKKGHCMHKNFNGRVYQQAEHRMISDSEDLGMPLRLAMSPHRASASKQKGGKTKPSKWSTNLPQLLNSYTDLIYKLQSVMCFARLCSNASYHQVYINVMNF